MSITRLQREREKSGVITGGDLGNCY